MKKFITKIVYFSFIIGVFFSFNIVTHADWQILGSSSKEGIFFPSPAFDSSYMFNDENFSLFATRAGTDFSLNLSESDKLLIFKTFNNYDLIEIGYNGSGNFLSINGFKKHSIIPSNVTFSYNYLENGVLQGIECSSLVPEHKYFDIANCTIKTDGKINIFETTSNRIFFNCDTTYTFSRNFGFKEYYKFSEGGERVFNAYVSTLSKNNSNNMLSSVYWTSFDKENCLEDEYIPISSDKINPLKINLKTNSETGHTYCLFLITNEAYGNYMKNEILYYKRYPPSEVLAPNLEFDINMFLNSKVSLKKGIKYSLIFTGNHIGDVVSKMNFILNDDLTINTSSTQSDSYTIKDTSRHAKVVWSGWGNLTTVKGEYLKILNAATIVYRLYTGDNIKDVSYSLVVRKYNDDDTPGDIIYTQSIPVNIEDLKADTTYTIKQFLNTSCSLYKGQKYVVSVIDTLNSDNKFISSIGIIPVSDVLKVPPGTFTDNFNFSSGDHTNDPPLGKPGDIIAPPDPGSPDDSNKPQGGIFQPIFDFFDKTIGSLFRGIKELFSIIINGFSEILNFSTSFVDFLSSAFSFLPSDLMSVIKTGISLMFVGFIIKIFMR